MGVRTAQRWPAIVDLPLISGRREGGGEGTAVDAVVLVAGARAAAVHSLLSSFIAGARRLPHTPRDTFLVLHGPGRSAGWAKEVQLASGTRSRHQVELTLNDPLLDRLTVVGVRAVAAQDGDQHRLVHDLLDRSGCLILVTDGRQPYQPAELDLMHAASARGHTILLAVTHVDEGPEWADVVQANQSKLARNFPDLAFRPWYPITRVRSGIADLRRAVVAWAARRWRPADGDAGADVTAPPIRLALQANESGWRELLRTDLERTRQEIAQVQAREFDQVRGVLAATAPREEPAVRLDTALQAMSLTLAAELGRTVERLLTQTLARILDEPVTDSVLDRVRICVRRDIAEFCSDMPACYRSLRVTATAAVAIASSREPVAALAAHAIESEYVLPPLGIGLTANCVPMLQALSAGNPQRERAWVERAIAVLELELDREIARQFGHLHHAITDLVSEALDHDLLLV